MRDFNFSLIVFGLEVEKLRNRKLFCLVGKKNERIKKVVCINLQLCPY